MQRIVIIIIIENKLKREVPYVNGVLGNFYFFEENAPTGKAQSLLCTRHFHTIIYLAPYEPKIILSLTRRYTFTFALLQCEDY